MAQQVTHLRCLVISPSDVKPEREAVGKAINRFNAHAGNGLAVIVEVVGWELHSYPDLSGPPQEKINEQVLGTCDFGIAIFWSRVGTPTTSHASGSVEEIEQLLSKGKKVLVYFCDRNVPLDAQLEQIRKLRADYYARGLVAGFESVQELELAVFTALSGLIPKLLQEPSQQLANPDIRVKATFGKIVEIARRDTAYPALQVRVENHSSRPLFLSQILLEGKGMATMQILDAYRRQVDAERTIDSGDSFNVTLNVGGITHLPWQEFVAVDKIGRRFTPPQGKFRDDLDGWNRWLEGNQTSDWDDFRGRAGAYFVGIESIPAKPEEAPPSTSLPVGAQPLSSPPERTGPTTNLSTEATAYLDELLALYVKTGFRSYQTWRFDKGKSGPVHNELAAHDIIKMTGTKGSGWRLTENGHRIVLARHQP